MNPALDALFERHVASSFDKQMHLAEQIGSLDWQLDLRRGVISFGREHTWRVQVLGTVSARTGTFLWGWAIQGGQVPTALQRVAEGMQRLGTLRDIPELIQPELERGDATGTRMALLAAGIFKTNAFYRAPYPGGAAFLLIADPSYQPADVTPAVRIPTVLPNVLKRYPNLDQRRVFEGYLAYYGLRGEPHGEDLLAQNGTGPVLRARFNFQNQLSVLEPVTE